MPYFVAVYKISPAPFIIIMVVKEMGERGLKDEDGLAELFAFEE